jgi:PBP1b-binding outer membrane lipoprotein LpoB
MDGGYYAIKGFEFQIDKTLLEVLTTTDNQSIVRLEQIQDIDTDDFVMQVKYKEASKLNPSVIRKPIVQLIEEYSSVPNKDYILYCYFEDNNGYSEEVDSELLERILGVKKDDFTDALKRGFLNKFQLRFSPEFHSQYESVLEKLQELPFCSSLDEAQYYYSILVDYLRKKVINNPPSNIGSRQVTNDEILTHLNNGRRIVFMPAYKDFIGQQAYFKLLKSQFLKPRKNQNTIFKFGEIEVVDSVTLQELIHHIVENHYSKATHDIKPITFVIPDSHAETVKRHFISQDCAYNDGFEVIQFNQRLFESPPIINKKTSGRRTTNSLSKTSFKARIISESTFNQLSEFGIQGSWVLVNTSKPELLEGLSFQVINQLNTQQIIKLF